MTNLQEYGASKTFEFEEFFTRSLRLSYMSIFNLMFAFQHLWEIFYASILKRQFNPYDFKVLLDFFIFACFLSYICITYAKNLDNTWTEKPIYGVDERAFIYVRNYHEWAYLELGLLVIFTVSMWIRVFYLLRYNEFLGKLTGIVSRLLYDVIIFFCFYLIELMFFSLVAELAFRRIPAFNTATSAFKNLFYASFG